ncbi:MAG: hypothetical protein WAO31_03785 [Rhodoluna sp.]
MEKRETELYLERQFAEAKPAVGEPAPDMVLGTLDGQTVALTDYRGTHIVVIKAGYT